MQEIKSNSYFNLKKVAQLQHDFSNDIQSFRSTMQEVKRTASYQQPENAEYIIKLMIDLCNDADRMKRGVVDALASISKYDATTKDQVRGKLRALRAFVDSSETDIIGAIRKANPEALKWKVGKSTDSVLQRIEMKYPYHLRDLRVKLTDFR